MKEFYNPYNLKEAILKGNIFTKLSMLVMGFGNLAHKQIGKGLMYLFVEALYVWFMITSGINSLSISNAAYLSSWTDNWVELPIDDDKFLEELNKRIETSTYVKKTVTDKVVDARGTYTK